MSSYSIESLKSDEDLDGVLEVEAESFTNPWTREMYAWELQNRAMCHILLVRTDDRRVVGFCAFWLVFDEIPINNVAIRPEYRGRGLGTAVMRHVLAEARRRQAFPPRPSSRFQTGSIPPPTPSRCWPWSSSRRCSW